MQERDNHDNVLIVHEVLNSFLVAHNNEGKERFNGNQIKQEKLMIHHDESSYQNSKGSVICDKWNNWIKEFFTMAIFST